jgi:hypothetical protein
MNNVTALRDTRLTRPAVDTGALLRRLTVWIGGISQAATAQSGRAIAAALHARAARYESTQPSFAADLRAAADSIELKASS